MMWRVAPTVVLLHGFTQTRRSWRRTVQALGGRYRALAPDLPGHGQAAHRVASFDACSAYLGALGPDRFTLAGYSMGGRVALHAALALGDRLDGLGLIGASPGLPHPAERAAPRAPDAAPAARIGAVGGAGFARGAAARPPRRAAEAALAAGIEAMGVAEFAGEWAAQPLFAGQRERVAAAAHADRLRNTAAGLAAALRGLGTGAMEPLWDRLPDLALPVTLLVGERDGKFRAIADQMAARLPDAQVVVVEGAGHAAHLEAPQAVIHQLGSPSSSGSE